MAEESALLVIAGAAVGFLASIGTTYANHRFSRDEARAGRRREVLEDVYRTLIKIRSQYGQLYSEILLRIKNNQPWQTEKQEDLPPLIHLEMLVGMYLPEFSETHKEFKKLIDDFGSKIIGPALSTKWENQNKQTTSKFILAMTAKWEAIEKEISSFRQKVSDAAQL